MKAAHDFGDVILLEQADGCDARGAGSEAGGGVIQVYPSQREDRDREEAGAAENIEASGTRIFSISFFENRGKESEVGARTACPPDFGRSVACHADGQTAGTTRSPRTLADPVCFRWGDVVCGKVDSTGSDRDGDVGAGIDEKNSSRFPVLSSQLRIAQDADSVVGQGFEVARGQLFLA